MPDTELERDETIRPDTGRGEAREAAAGVPRGRHGHRRQLLAAQRRRAALLLADEAGAKAAGREPLARIVSRGLHAVDPPLYGIAPVEAANKALERAGIGWGDLALVELNEAFAAQSLACLAEWPSSTPRS